MHASGKVANFMGFQVITPDWSSELGALCSRLVVTEISDERNCELLTGKDVGDVLGKPLHLRIPHPVLRISRTHKYVHTYSAITRSGKPSVAVQWLALPFYIWEAPVLNLGLETGYLDRIVVVVLSPSRQMSA